MQLPERYLPLLGPKGLLGIKVDEARRPRPREWPEPATYPPPGFLPFSAFELGNGDAFGFYWPVGREGSEPIVCELHHDGWELDPCAADLEGLVRFLAASGRVDEDEGLEREELVELAGALHCEVPPIAPALRGPPPEPPPGETSPALALAIARAAIRRGELDAAHGVLLRAVERLPEYAAAWVALAQLRKRQGDAAGSARALLEALSSPQCFGADRERLLKEAQRIPDESAPALREDPLWARRARLRFKTGEKRSDDPALLEEAIAAYLAAGDGVRAVRLRVLHGERMWTEAISFQERYGFTLAKHLETLRAELTRAGLGARLAALGAKGSG